MDFAIIRNAGELTASLQKQGKLAKSYRAIIHINAISCLWHAATTGNPGMLNRFYAKLVTNEQTALRTYIDRLQNKLIRVNNKDSFEKDDEGNRLPTDVKFLYYEDRTFKVIPKDDAAKHGLTEDNVMPYRANFAKLAESTLINPQGKEGQRFFYERNNVADSRELYVDDAKVMKAVQNLLNRQNTKISPKVRQFAQEFIDKTESVVEQADGMVEPSKQDKATIDKYWDDFDKALDTDPHMIADAAKDMDAAATVAPKTKDTGTARRTAAN